MLTLTYVLIKFVYLGVALLQIHLMNIFLSSRSNTFYGFQVVQSILNGTADLGPDLSDSKVFPRVTVCDVRTRELAADHTYTVQCVLSFNLFNERIYAFLWFWIFVIVVPFTCVDLCSWMVRLFVRGSRYRVAFIKSRIRIYAGRDRQNLTSNSLTSKRERKLVRIFTEDYLGADGVFVLRLLEHNSNAAIVSELIYQMWSQFRIEQKE